jgi:molecular chaperone DnaK
MYQQASQKGEQQAEAGAEGAAQPEPGPSTPDEDVVDADFEEVKNDDKK